MHKADFYCSSVGLVNARQAPVVQRPLRKKKLPNEMLTVSQSRAAKSKGHVITAWSMLFTAELRTICGPIAAVSDA